MLSASSFIFSASSALETTGFVFGIKTTVPNPPATVIGLGDVSLAFGEPGDYELAAEVLKPLTDAGIKLVLAMGTMTSVPSF